MIGCQVRIVAVETFVLKVATDAAYLGPLRDGSILGAHYEVRKPWRSLYSSRYETLLVKVTAEDGTAGWGEALAPVAPEVLETIVRLLLAPVLVGADAATPATQFSMLRDLMRERGHLVGHQADALAAVDIALWDLAGKLAGRSVAELLGGARRTRLPAYVSGIPFNDDEARVARAREWVAGGATAVKLHLGLGVDADLATVASIREACPTLRVAVDGHWAYTLEDAKRLSAGLAEFGAWFLEAPLEPEDRKGHAALVKAGGVPIAIGETLRNRYEFGDWIEDGALQIAQPDIARTGITEGVVIAGLAAAHGIPVAPHHSVALGIALAAGLHVAAAVDELFAFEYQPTSTEVGQRILSRSIEHTASSFTLPAGPGLGISVDENAVIRLAKESQ